MAEPFDHDAWEKRMKTYRDGMKVLVECLQKLSGDEEMTANQVMIQQFYLNCLGYNCGAVDGIEGQRTAKAWDAFWAAISNNKWFNVEHTPFNLALRHYAEQKLPRHLIVAAQYLGEKEITGINTNPLIPRMWKALGLNIYEDSTPWCSAFEAKIITDAGYATPQELKAHGVTASARSWMNYSFGSTGFLGDIAVFWRGSKDGWKGHVNTVVGKDENGNLWCIGGNQGDSVSVSLFTRDRLLGFMAFKKPYRDNLLPLPLITAAAPLSTDEA